MSLPPTFKNTETPPSPDSLSSPLPSSPLSVSLSPSFFIHLHSTYHLTHYEFYLFAYCFPPPLDYKFQEENKNRCVKYMVVKQLKASKIKYIFVYMKQIPEDIH